MKIKNKYDFRIVLNAQFKNVRVTGIAKERRPGPINKTGSRVRIVVVTGLSVSRKSLGSHPRTLRTPSEIGVPNGSVTRSSVVVVKRLR